MSNPLKAMRGFEICISEYIIQYELYEQISIQIKKLRSFSKIPHSRRSGQETEKPMITLMKYIQMVLTNMKEKVTQQSLSTVAILIHPLTVFQIGMMYWVVVGNSQR